MNAEAEAKPKFDVYTAMLLGTAVFLLIGSILMSVELSRYGGFLKGYPWWNTPARATGS